MYRIFSHAKFFICSTAAKVLLLDCSWLLLEESTGGATTLQGPSLEDGLHPSAAGYEDLQRACWAPALGFLQQLPPREAPPSPLDTTYYSDVPNRRANSEEPTTERGAMAMMAAWLRGQSAGRRLRL